MATVEDQGLGREIEEVTYESDPLGYCKGIYAEAIERYEQLLPYNVENQNFYEGRDPELDARKNDPRVKRSAIFVHELTPAVDSIVGDIVATLEQQDMPVRIRPKMENPDEDTRQMVSTIERRINQQMRECGYLTRILKEQVLASQIYRSPATVKVDWCEKTEEYAEVVPMMERVVKAIKDIARGRKPSSVGVRWRRRKVGYPEVAYLRPDQFLYEPNVVLANGAYKICVYNLDTAGVVSYVKSWDGYDKEQLQEFIDSPGGGDDATHQAVSDIVRSDEGTETTKTIQQVGPHRVCENWITTYDSDGYTHQKVAVTIGDRFLVYNGDSPYKGIQSPFVSVVPRPLPGQPEGLSTVDIGKPLQKVHNEGYNYWADSITYGQFGPLKNRSGNAFQGTPILEPGAIFWLPEPEMLTPVYPIIGAPPDLPAFVQMSSAKIRNITNASDTEQGFNAAQYEKATSTKARMLGTAKRSVPVKKIYGEAVIEVVKIFLKMNQQFAEDAEAFVADVLIDVPSLTSVTDPEQEKQDDVLLLSTLAQMPMYQTPEGTRKIRNLLEDMVRKFKRNDVFNFVFTPAELEKDIQLQAQMQSLLTQKQSMMESAAMTQQSAGQPPAPTEGQ
jgi:hypothetical protein